tara:strand:+ start:13110 stop:13430 length:321 start_codon:yes stop_codon:yes gene_type:complete
MPTNVPEADGCICHDLITAVTGSLTERVILCQITVAIIALVGHRVEEENHGFAKTFIAHRQFQFRISSSISESQLVFSTLVFPKYLFRSKPKLRKLFLLMAINRRK